MSNIPSEEDFARAKRRMRERDRNIGHVNSALRKYFLEVCPDNAHDSHVIAEEDSKFRAYIFYKKDEDVQMCKENGVSSQLRQFVYDELERQGRGSKTSVAVEFEFDSDENVQSSFDGDYFLRMR